MKNLFAFLLITLCLLVAVPAAVAGLTLKIATLAPEGAFEVVQMKQAAEEIQTQTQDRVKFKFFTGGVMGNDQGVLRKIRINQLQGGAVSSGSLSTYYPDSQIYALPLVFKSFDEVDYVRSVMDPILMKGYEDSGFVTFGIAEGGFAHIMSNNPVATVAELQQQKVWIPENDRAALEAVKAFNVSPIPLSIADVRTGLQTGMIDTVAIPPAYAIVLHWHTQVKHITQIPLLYTFGILAIDKAAFDKLQPADQTIVRTTMEASFKRIDRHNREQNSQAMAVLADMGIAMVTPDAATLAQWQSKADGIASLLVEEKILSPQILATINRLLSEFRAK